MLAEASRLASGILLRPEPGERERGCVAKLAHLCEQIEPVPSGNPMSEISRSNFSRRSASSAELMELAVYAAWVANIPIVPNFRERSRDEASE
ncbi:MAG: hypothetical protein H0T95_02760 [Chthoniobacterales bacterium]|nr:hypothetical protein [Chthoniobacterales bacterium]